LRPWKKLTGATSIFAFESHVTQHASFVAAWGDASWSAGAGVDLQKGVLRLQVGCAPLPVQEHRPAHHHHAEGGNKMPEIGAMKIERFTWGRDVADAMRRCEAAGLIDTIDTDQHSCWVRVTDLGWDALRVLTVLTVESAVPGVDRMSSQ
jgi:hypothetical protein